MRLVIDMNLPEEWVPALAKHGFEAVHWSTLGSATAEDSEIMEWANLNSYVVFTHDLDFGALLAASGADRPSIFQVRTLGVLPSQIEPLVVVALQQFKQILEDGAFVTVDEKRARARVLPLMR